MERLADPKIVEAEEFDGVAGRVEFERVVEICGRSKSRFVQNRQAASAIWALLVMGITAAGDAFP